MTNIIPLHTTNNVTLQWFLTEGPYGVCEVGSVEIEEGLYALRCTCPAWSKDGDTCSHAAYVAAQILAHPRHYYPTRIPGGLIGTNINEAITDPYRMRHWLIHYQEILVD